MNQQRFDESTLIRIFALHELHRLKEHGLWLIFTGGKVWMTITTSTANA